MSVTIHQSPDLVSPSDNPLTFTFSSNLTAQANFSYLVDIYVNGTKIKTQQVFPESGDYGRIDVSAWTSNTCSAPSITTSFTSDALNNCTYHIVVWERYGTPPIKHASATSATLYAFKAGLAPDEFIDYDPDTYRFPAGSSQDFFTNFNGGYSSGTKSTGYYPTVKRSTEQFKIMVMNYFTDMTNFNIRLFDAAGGSVSSWTGTPLTSANLFTVVDLSPAQLVASTTITQVEIDLSSYMIIRVVGVTRDFRINFDDSCTYPRYKRIHFLSQLGSLESFTFGLVSRESGTITTKSYKRVFGQWDGDQFVYNKERAVNVNYAKTVNPKLKIVSDWIPEIVQNWLVKQLRTSVQVYEEGTEEGLGNLLERKIDSKGYEFKYNDNDMLFLEEIVLALHSYTTMVL